MRRHAMQCGERVSLPAIARERRMVSVVPFGIVLVTAMECQSQPRGRVAPSAWHGRPER